MDIAEEKEISIEATYNLILNINEKTCSTCQCNRTLYRLGTEFFCWEDYRNAVADEAHRMYTQK